MLRSELHKHLPPVAIELFMDMVASSIKPALIVNDLLQADHFEAAKMTSNQAAGELHGLMTTLAEMKQQAVDEGEKRKKATTELAAAIKVETKPAVKEEAPPVASVPDTQTPAG